MAERILSEETINTFREYLVLEEKSTATVEKYLRDVRAFHLFACQQAVTKERMMAYKKYLIEKGYAASSINSMLASLNSLLDFQGWSDCKVKNIKTQRQTYCAEEKELTKSEYLRLLEAAKDRPQLHLILETICGTGIRVSELRFFNAEAVKRGEITVSCKSKTRTILLPSKLMCCAECRIHLVETQHSVRNITFVLWSKDWGQVKNNCCLLFCFCAVRHRFGGAL